MRRVGRRYGVLLPGVGSQPVLPAGAVQRDFVFQQSHSGAVHVGYAIPAVRRHYNERQNANASWYNSMQLGYEVRAKNGLTLVANWTLSKQVYQNGYNDIQQQVSSAASINTIRPTM